MAVANKGQGYDSPILFLFTHGASPAHTIWMDHMNMKWEIWQCSLINSYYSLICCIMMYDQFFLKRKKNISVISVWENNLRCPHFIFDVDADRFQVFKLFSSEKDLREDHWKNLTKIIICDDDDYFLLNITMQMEYLHSHRRIPWLAVSKTSTYMPAPSPVRPQPVYSYQISWQLLYAV